LKVLYPRGNLIKDLNFKTCDLRNEELFCNSIEYEVAFLDLLHNIREDRSYRRPHQGKNNYYNNCQQDQNSKNAA
jgi:hypothetical protein